MDKGMGMRSIRKTCIGTRTHDTHIRLPAGYIHTRVKHYNPSFGVTGLQCKFFFCFFFYKLTNLFIYKDPYYHYNSFTNNNDNNSLWEQKQAPMTCRLGP